MIGFLKEHVPSHRSRIVLLLLWTLLLIWLRPWTGDLRSDPLTYACIAKDMMENNHWFSPMLDGSPYLNKPPFYFWFVALSFKLFGVSTYASKLPSLVFATVNVFFLYWIVFQWFRDYDLAFFSAFSFATTRWIVRNFSTNRPESLLVFSMLLGCYAVTLMNSEKKKGPYLFGLSFSIGFMTKLFFASFLPFAVVIYGLVKKRMSRWLKWPHFYLGILLGLVLTSLWFVWYEKIHPGYMWHIFNTQTLSRVTEGLDVNTNPLMYATEFLKYYQPWLIFFIVGIPLLWKNLRQNEYYWLVASAIVVMFVPLQVAKGKAERYLSIVTPFLSIVTALGVCHFEKVRKFMKGFTVYGLIPLFVFFWAVPVRVNPEKFHVLHLAERLRSDETVDYTDTLSFMRAKKDEEEVSMGFVEWTPFNPGQEYRLIYYFYLSDRFTQWRDDDLQRWIRNGSTPIILLTHPRAVRELPWDSASWIELDEDRYHVLLMGLRK